jgi:hypothetical protein
MRKDYWDDERMSDRWMQRSRRSGIAEKWTSIESKQRCLSVFLSFLHWLR